MFKSYRSSYIVILVGFLLVSLVSGFVLTGRAGAAPRFAFLQSVGDLFKGSKDSKAAKNSPDADSDSDDGSESDDPDRKVVDTGMSDEEYLLKRAEAIGEKRGVENGKPFDPRLRINAIRQMESQEARLTSPLTAPPAWTEIGPNPIPNGQVVSGTSSVSGRTISIAIHPTNPNIAYVGTAQGGLYRTVDGGTTWTPLMDNALSLAIGAIAIAPSSPDTVYVGTGEPEFSADSFFGVGIYRITNASTASPTLSGPFGGTEMSGRAVSEIVVDPANAANIFATTTIGRGGFNQASPATPLRGLFRSNNATAATPTFTKLTVVVAGEDLDMTDLAMDLANANRVLVAVIGAAGQSGVWLSTNALGAATFTRQLALAGTTRSTARTELAIANVAGTVPVFAASANATTGTLYRSVDGGVNWATPGGGGGFCGGQCFYNIAVAVDPTNASNVYLGGSTGNNTFLFSNNGGTSFTSSVVGLHTDTQVLAVAPSSPSAIYFGSDGGIWRSTNSGANWTSLNNSTFKATQFQSVAVHPIDPNFTIGGTQDNGTLYRSPSGAWSLTDLGDGGFTAIDRNATDTVNVTMYHGYVNNFLYRSTTAGNSWNSISSGISGTSLFYPPFTLGPGNPNTTYFGSTLLFRSTNTGTNWSPASQDLVNPISTIGVSPQNDDVRIVGTNVGQLFGVFTGLTPLIDLDPTNTIPNNYIGRAVIDPNNPGTAYVALSAFGVANVWKTTTYVNLFSGNAPVWAAANTGLPQVPVNAFLVDPANSNYLYAGTDIGVYYSSNGGASWNPMGVGLPRVAVFDIAKTAGGQIRIATHGRGMWQILAPTAAPIIATTATLVTESFVPANGVIDPGETVTVAFGVQNLGYADTVNDVGTLQNTGGVTSAGAAQNYGVIVVDAPTVSKNFTFRASPSLTCGQTITATIQHQDGAATLGSVTYNLPTGSPGATSTASYAGPPVAIPDANTTGVDVVLPVSGVTGNISDVNFRLDSLAGCDANLGNTNASVTHTYVGDLLYTLRSPSGTTVSLIANRGGAGVNLCTITLDDDGGFPAVVTMPTTGAVSGNFAPESPLSAFDGQNPNGNWTLHVADVAGGDTGTVNRFSLIVSGTTCLVGPTPTNTGTPTNTATPTPAGSPVISGIVTYGNAAAPPKYISNATVTGTGSPNVFTTTAAPGGTAGQYSLTGFGTGSYTVSLSKTTGQNGITSNDAARIAQHVSGALLLTTINQKVTADVSNNGVVSSFDAAQIATFVASGSSPGIAGQWRFFVPPGPTFPVASSPTSRSYASVLGNTTGQDYIGLLIGDVTGNWAPSAARTVGSWQLAVGSAPDRGISMLLPQFEAGVGKEIILPVNVQGVANKGVISYEFDLRYDPSVIQPLENPVDVKGTASRGLAVVTNATEPGLLRVVVYGAFPIDKDGVLLNLRFTAVGAAGSFSPLTFERIMFNEGDSKVEIAGGQVRLN